ncbi:MAG TPA: nucleoside deaminase [Chitinophagaceae bacterium]|nr:nucleoside deaminase [Chitinophagaceae bacterium]
MTREEKFMAEAIRVGTEGMRNNIGGPFGCVIVKDDKIVGKGCNSVTSLNDPTAHAEIMAIRDACKTLGTINLADCEVYTSCEPCPMCLGAIYWSRPAKIYYSNTRYDARDAGFDDEFIYRELLMPLKSRAISIQCIKDREAKKMFEEWLASNKTLY